MKYLQDGGFVFCPPYDKRYAENYDRTFGKKRNKDIPQEFKETYPDDRPMRARRKTVNKKYRHGWDRAFGKGLVPAPADTDGAGDTGSY